MILKPCLVFAVFVSGVANNVSHANNVVDVTKIPQDCTWGNWGAWDSCPNCKKKGWYADGEEIKIHRIRKVTHAGNRYGACYSHTNLTHSLPMSKRKKDVEEIICNNNIGLCKESPRDRKPIDCIWADWSEWDMDCPDCRDLSYWEEGELIERYKDRAIKKRGNPKGKCYSYKDIKQEHNLKMRDRRSEEQIEECKEVAPCTEITATWTEWGKWGDCIGDCGKQGVETRVRNCTGVTSDGSPPDIEKAKERCEILIQFSNNNTDLISDRDQRTCPVVCKGASLKSRKNLEVVETKIEGHSSNDIADALEHVIQQANHVVDVAKGILVKLTKKEPTDNAELTIQAL